MRKFDFQGEVNDWMPRLIYGILSLILGAMALLLPETRKVPLPRTMIQVEFIPTSISKRFRRQRSILVKKTLPTDGPGLDGRHAFSDMSSVVSGLPAGRPYDNQSTLHSVYELQEVGQDDTLHLTSNRNAARRMDLPNPSFYQPFSSGGTKSDIYRQQLSIAEDAEYDVDDLNDDGVRLGLQRRVSEHQQQLAAALSPNIPTDDVIILPAASRRASAGRQSTTEAPSQLEATAQIQAGDVTGDRHELSATTPEEKDDSTRNASRSTRYQRTMSQDENYFSEHS